MLMLKVKYDKVFNVWFVDFLVVVLCMLLVIILMVQDVCKKVEDLVFLVMIEEGEKDILNRDVEIMCLGISLFNFFDICGLCGIFVWVFGIGNYFFDCGEGVYGQMCCCFGFVESGKIFVDLKCIVISYIYGDYVFGIVSMIKVWYNQMLKDGNYELKLVILCSVCIRMVIEEIFQVEDIGFY